MVRFGCDRSVGNAYSSSAPDPTFAFVGGPCCPTLDFVIAVWIMIKFYTWLTLLFCILVAAMCILHFKMSYEIENNVQHAYFAMQIIMLIVV
jgi:hypothetical protein